MHKWQAECWQETTTYFWLLKVVSPHTNGGAALSASARQNARG